MELTFHLMKLHYEHCFCQIAIACQKLYQQLVREQRKLYITISDTRGAGFTGMHLNIKVLLESTSVGYTSKVQQKSWSLICSWKWYKT